MTKANTQARSLLCVPMRHATLPRVMVHTEDDVQYYISRGYAKDYTPDAMIWEQEVRNEIALKQSIRWRFNRFLDRFLGNTRFSRLGPPVRWSMPFVRRR